MTYELKRCRRRNPVIWLAMIALAAVLGISSRRFAAMLPGFIAAYAGDTFWALAAFLGIGLILPRISTCRVASLAMMFSVMIELSQLYQVRKIRALLFHGLRRLGKIDWASESHQELDRCLSRTITASKNFND